MESEPVITINDLPLSFTVKYLGWEPARGLWGMKHTRKPVDNLVKKAKDLPPNKILPIVNIEINTTGLSYHEITKNSAINSQVVKFGVNEISYGVQDVIYTRVFSMIVVTDKSLDEGFTFICHSFVCEGKNEARQLTYALAAVFQDYAEKMRKSGKSMKQQKFAIDLRTPEQQTEAEMEETDA